MSDLNKVIFTGNLTRDPETKEVGSGTVTEFGMAVNTSYYSKATSSQKEDVCFIDVSFWGKRGEAINKYFRKGDPILVEGRLALRQWEDKETGAKRSKHSLVGDNFLFTRGKSQSTSSNEEHY